jgi:hypothetical protein
MTVTMGPLNIDKGMISTHMHREKIKESFTITVKEAYRLNILKKVSFSQ